MIRRLLTLVLVLLVWTVQTADAAVDHSDVFVAGVGSTGVAIVEDASTAPEGADGGWVCNAGCICPVSHLGVLQDGDGLLTQLPASGEGYALTNAGIAVFLTSPPTRPPLV